MQYAINDIDHHVIIRGLEDSDTTFGGGPLEIFGSPPIKKYIP